jgi:protein-tyrosine phosphatase
MEIFEMLPGKLWQSSQIDDWAAVHRVLPDVLIDLEGGIDSGVPTHALTYIYWPIVDGPLPADIANLEALSSYVCHRFNNSKRVWVHCAAGINRASLLSGLVLYDYEGLRGQALIDTIRARRPGALTNQAFVGYLLGLP